VLGTALNVYATTDSLGGTTAQQYGFKGITAYGLGAADFNVGPDGQAFGVAPSTMLNVYELLQRVNARAVQGVLYYRHQDLVGLAMDVFDAIAALGGL
jgi:hypothetical protein